MEIARQESIDFNRVFDILTYQERKYPNAQALHEYDQGYRKPLSIQEVKEASIAAGCWFLRQGFQPGEKIMLVPVSGHARWMIVDFGCQMARLVTVPVHPTLREEEMLLVMQQTEARICITADEELRNKFSSCAERHRIQMTFLTLDDVCGLEWGASSVTATERARLEALSDSITQDEVHTILYTSGSTGTAKGVMLTHRNLCHNIRCALMLLPLEPGMRAISFLPFSHIFERASCYAYVAFGVSLSFSRSREYFEADLQEVKPHFCTAVPRVLEKMYDYLEERRETKNPVVRHVVSWAMDTGKKYDPDGRSIVFRMKLLLARMLVLRYWRRALGGRIRYMAVGAASLRPEIARLFSAAGIRILEGYGMTETAPTISMNRPEPGQQRYGTVGIPVPGTEVRIDAAPGEDEGEILVKGPHVMAGYFKRPEWTAESFTEDGWFKTGDVGKFEEGRFLCITDRKKDLFKTSSGKYIAPLQLQNHFTQSPFIGRIMVIGFQRPFVTAIIVPHFELLKRWCEEQDIHWTSPSFMVHNIKVLEKYKQEVEGLNGQLPNVERVRRFVLCDEEWSVDRGEITTTMKPVRHTLMDRYARDIEKMYEEG